MRIVYWMILLFITPCFAAQKTKVLHIASVSNNPHSIHAERILRKAYRNIGYGVVFHPLPSKRALAEAAAGKFDGEIVRVDGVSKKYPSLIKVPTPYLQMTAFAYSKIYSGTVISSWADLKGFRIGIKRGVLFAEIETKGMNVYRVDTSTDLFRLLNAGRVDFVIENEFIAQLTLKENSNLNAIKKVGGSIYSAPLFHYLHCSQHHVASLLDSEFQRLLEESATTTN